MGKRNAEIDEALGKLTIEALTQETLTLRNAYTLMVSEKWEIHRANLTEGKPCPLCGSTTHPYHTDNRQFEEATTELSQLLKVKEDLLKLQQKEEKNLSGERKQNDGEVQTLQKQQEKLSGEIASYEEEWKALIAQYPKIPKAEAELKSLLPIYENIIVHPRGPVLPDIRRTGPHLSCCHARRSRSADCRWSDPDYKTGS